ncbi:MAG TPA: hypothetical protein VJM34_02930 [Novosphingobium sp.]|nr:hypothetical protein [Novosphingobium sp.]
MANVDLSFENASAIVNGVTFTADESIVSGTGGYFTFLAVQNNGGTEEGYNHDETGGTAVLDTDNSKTQSLAIAQMEVVNVSGTNYYVLRLDMNEPGNATGNDAPLRMLEFKLYSSNTIATSGSFVANQDGVGDGGLGAGFNKFYDIDTGGDNTLLMKDLSSGSGGDDYQVLIPTNIVSAGTYLTLYWKFDEAQAGYEEARALTVPFVADPDIDVEKEVSVDGGVTWADADTATGPFALATNDIRFRFTVTNTGNVALTNVAVDDSDFDIEPGAGDVWNIGALAAGGTAQRVFQLDEATQFTVGQHVNTATVTGNYNAVQVTDSDDAHYWGVVGEGLSHGYWKNHGPDDGARNDWDVTTGEASSFETFFGVNATSWLLGTNGKKAITAADVSFEQALGLTGGGYQALAREAVAAVLNSRDEDISYGYSEATIIDMVQDAFSTGNFEYYKNLLENENISGNWM